METASTGHAWIRQRSQPLLTQKKSMKTESVSTGKSSMKQIAKVTLGFISAPNPFGLRNRQRKLSRCRLRNRHPNSFQRRRVDSEARPTPVDLEKANEN
jgi:hypothetical protein